MARPAAGDRVVAVWKETVVAASDRTVVLEGRHYFPPDDVRWEFLQSSDKRSVCPWKGQAGYYDLEVGAQRNRGAAWVYPHPHPAAAQIKDHVAFWKGVKVRRADDVP